MNALACSWLIIIQLNAEDAQDFSSVMIASKTSDNRMTKIKFSLNYSYKHVHFLLNRYIIDWNCHAFHACMNNKMISAYVVEPAGLSTYDNTCFLRVGIAMCYVKDLLVWSAYINKFYSSFGDDSFLLSNLQNH